MLWELSNLGRISDSMIELIEVLQSEGSSVFELLEPSFDASWFLENIDMAINVNLFIGTERQKLW